MKIPQTIKVGSQTYTVEITDDIREDGDHGRNYEHSGKILIASNLSQQQKEQTFLHELMHTAYSFTGLKDDEKCTEEEFIRRIEAPLYMILEENKLF